MAEQGQQGADVFAAALVRTSARVFGAYAAERLLEREPGVRRRFEMEGFGGWRDFLSARLDELAAALQAGEPELLLSQVRWNVQAFLARGVPVQDLQSALRCVREVLASDLPPRAAEPACAYMDAAVAAAGEYLAPSGLDEPTALTPLAKAYLDQVLAGRRSEAWEIIRKAFESGTPPQDLYLDVLIPASREIGRLWHVGEVSIAQEHAATTTTQSVMARLVGLARPAQRLGRTVVVAGVSGNTHDMAVRVLADFFELDGWETVCLGGDLPEEEIAAAAVGFAASVVALSATLSTHIPSVTRAVALVREASREEGGRPARVLVGGRPFEAVPGLWERVGADGWAPDARQALVEARRLVGLAAETSAG